MRIQCINSIFSSCRPSSHWQCKIYLTGLVQILWNYCKNIRIIATPVSSTPSASKCADKEMVYLYLYVDCRWTNTVFICRYAIQAACCYDFDPSSFGVFFHNILLVKILKPSSYQKIAFHNAKSSVSSITLQLSFSPNWIEVWQRGCYHKFHPLL